MLSIVNTLPSFSKLGKFNEKLIVSGKLELLVILNTILLIPSVSGETKPPKIPKGIFSITGIGIVSN